MKVHHVFQQTGFRRVKRGFRDLRLDDAEVMGRLVNSPKAIQKKERVNI